MTTWPSATTGKLEERYTPSPGWAVLVFTPLCSARRTLVPAGTSIVFAGGVAAGVATPAVVAAAPVGATGAAASEGAGVAAGAGETSVVTGEGEGSGAVGGTVCAPAMAERNIAEATNLNIFLIVRSTPVILSQSHTYGTELIDEN